MRVSVAGLPLPERLTRFTARVKRPTLFRVSIGPQKAQVLSTTTSPAGSALALPPASTSIIRVLRLRTVVSHDEC